MPAKTGESSQHDKPGTPARAPRHPFAGAVWLFLVLAAAVIAGLLLGVPRLSPPHPRPRVVVASVPYWNIQHATAAVLANRQAVTEVSPWIYGLDGSGQIATQYGPGRAAAINADVARLRAAGMRIVPSLANVTGGLWSYQPVARMLHSPERMARQIDKIVRLVEANHYAGIDIDYEQLRAGDRQDFTTFCDHLASALHAKGKLLSVALFAKTSDAGTSPTNVAQDYNAIGQAADQVRLMGYDYHWASSAPGPIAPVGWLRDVLRYAKTQIPADKIVLGVPLYGYDWSGGHGTAISWLQAFRLSREYHAAPRYDTRAQAPWFAYTDAAGRKHTVWLENAASSRAKFAAAQGAGINGVYLWMFGYEDTGTWAALRQVLPVSGPHAPSRARPSP
ncbi:MAG TPA: glycosyl hydrolase family 18 protein [Streptosporangiaceae bacterium]|nr:glycosyl hydrolase family 18 protein [Streptosporangiaceae bacterium]